MLFNICSPFSIIVENGEQILNIFYTVFHELSFLAVLDRVHKLAKRFEGVGIRIF